MIDEVLNCVCRSIIAIANYRGAISVKIILWMGSLSFQGSSVFLLTVPLSVTTNHVTHPGEELHPCSALQQTGDLSSRGRWFRQHRGTAADKQPAAGAQRYETSASLGFLLSVVGPAVISRYTLRKQHPATQWKRSTLKTIFTQRYHQHDWLS